MIRIDSRGDFSRTLKFLKKNKRIKILDKYGVQGVKALSSATPVLSGKTAQSWSYEIVDNGKTATINFSNSNINKGVNIAIILQYGHGTRNGGYVQGRDYINPAIQPVFDKMVEEVWSEVIKA